MGKFFLETYGCQMNVAESFSVERELTNLGWQQAESETEARPGNSEYLRGQEFGGTADSWTDRLLSAPEAVKTPFSCCDAAA